MTRKKHNHNNRANPKTQVSSHDEYDISTSFQRIGLYKGKISSMSSTLPPEGEVAGDRIVESGAGSAIPGYTDPNSFWAPYSQLDNKIASFQTLNESAHTDLRNVINTQINNLNEQLSNKIDSKLSTNWFRWTISAIVAAIVAFVTVIYLLSYSGLLDTVKSHTEKIQSLEHKAGENSFSIQSLEKKVHEKASDKEN